MKDNYTHICIVLDASGSMACVENETKSSFNSFIREQQNAPGEATLDMYQFADESAKIIDFADLGRLQKNLMDKYHCHGCTALNDAVCRAIDETGRKLASMREEERPSKVLFAILTDGEENASRRFTNAHVKQRIRHQTEAYSWVFIFLGANQDAFATGGEMGISADMCLNVDAGTSEGVARTARILGQVAYCYRSAAPSCDAPGIVLSDIADEVDAGSRPKGRRKQGKSCR